MTDNLVDRLRRQDLFDLHGSVALVNPDGPEAANVIEKLEDALSECRLIVANLPHDEELLLAKIDAALSLLRGDGK